MRILYNILTYIASAFLWIAGFFSPKLKLFVDGRKNTFQVLSEKLNAADKTVWFHCASLGEFEQGLPIMEATKAAYPSYKIVVSFFSPSGFENKKNAPVADAVVYLPMDTRNHAKTMLQAIHPTLVIFVKYEFWPNYLFELKNQHVPTLLISGIFREDQPFFKSYGSLMRNALQSFNHFFLQDDTSEVLLNHINIHNTTVSGDTRFDRVSHQIEQDNSLDFIENFKEQSLCVVCGSTWPEDEAVLLESINKASDTIKYIIAPHNIDHNKIESFRKKVRGRSLLFSEKEGKQLREYSVLIIDTIGLLTKIYSYADIAYVGGAMGTTGLHNILEPATFGVPIVIGKNYAEFPEAIKLRSLAGLYSIDSQKECTAVLDKLIEDSSFRNKTGMIAGHFVNQNTGATTKVMSYIKEKKVLNSDSLV